MANPGTQIRRRRLALGWTQAELGARLGWHRSQVCRLERGQTDPRASLLARVARALKCKKADLMAG